MNLKQIIAAAALACSALLAQTSNAAVIFFTDRAAFESAITVGQRVDFETAFPSGTTSITFGDATFVSTDGSGVHRTDPGTFNGLTTRLAAQSSGGIRIDLVPGYFAIGLDVGELFGINVGDFVLMGSSNIVLDSRSSPVGYFGPAPLFVGYISTEAIGSLSFNISVPSFFQFETIDNVTLGAPTGIPPSSTVPEPSTYVLMLAGLGFVGFVSHRRRRA